MSVASEYQIGTAVTATLSSVTNFGLFAIVRVGLDALFPRAVLMTTSMCVFLFTSVETCRR